MDFGIGQRHEYRKDRIPFSHGAPFPGVSPNHSSHQALGVRVQIRANRLLKLGIIGRDQALAEGTFDRAAWPHQVLPAVRRGPKSEGRLGASKRSEDGF
jgi:hypothetical protein